MYYWGIKYDSFILKSKKSIAAKFSNFRWSEDSWENFFHFKQLGWANRLGIRKLILPDDPNYMKLLKEQI